MPRLRHMPSAWTHTMCMPFTAGPAMSEREIGWKEKTSLIGLKKRHDCGGVVALGSAGRLPRSSSRLEAQGSIIYRDHPSWCSFVSPMILLDRYGPRLRDEGGCRSRKRLSRLHVTLPGCWVRVSRRAGLLCKFWIHRCSLFTHV